MSQTIEIPLTQGLVALVDEADFESVNAFKWCVSQGYAAAWMGKKIIRMHRFLLSVTDKGVEVDHINGNRLDNRRSNLRTCTRSENTRNKGGLGGTSEYKGVYRHSDGRHWIAQIRATGPIKYLGCFQSEHDAALAYNEAANKYHGEFARINKIECSRRRFEAI